MSARGTHLNKIGRENISKALIGRKLSENHKLRLSESHMGHKPSEKTKIKMSESRKGHKPRLGMITSEETKRKISEALKGKNKTLTHILKVSEALKGKPGRKGWNHTIETKEKISKSKQGEKCYAWKGGITKRIFDFRWRILAQKIYARDNWCCQICKKICKSKEIQCHHKIPYRISKNNNLDNLITLCKSCHMKEEHKFNQGLLLSPFIGLTCMGK